MTYVKKVAERNFLYWSLYDSEEDGKGEKGEEDNEKDERMRKIKREKMVVDSVRSIFEPCDFIQYYFLFMEPYFSIDTILFYVY